jgi:transcription elongation factor
LYQDELAFELIPLTLLRIIEHSSWDIAPFVLSARTRALPAFAASIKHFAQDSIQVDDRIQKESGEHTGIISQIRDICANVADIIIQIPKQHSGLIVCVSLRDLISYFVAGDHVKIHWLDQFGMVIAVDHNTQIVTFLNKKTNTEVCPPSFSHFWRLNYGCQIQMLAFSLQSHSSL